MDDEETTRQARVQALSPPQRDELRALIGEAALDLWARIQTIPDLVERCLEAVEEDETPPSAKRIPVHAVRDDPE